MLELRQGLSFGEFGLKVHPASAFMLIILTSVTAKAKEEWALGWGKEKVGRCWVC